MKKRNIPLGKILGIQIGLDYTWFLIFALISWSLSTDYFPFEFKGWKEYEYWTVGIFTSLLLFVSVLLHELGHSIIALNYKIKVKQISLFLFGGVAEIAGEPPKASAEFWIAIAGPLTSILLALIFSLLQSLFTGFIQIFAFFKYLAYINFVLALFNLIPGFPLDGGRIFRAIVWGITKDFHKATNIAVLVGRFFGFAFIFFGTIQTLGGNLSNGIWIAFIGWFLESASNQQLQQQALKDTLEGHTVFEAMTNDYAIIPDDTTIQEVMDNHILGIGRRSLFIKKDDKFIGMLTLHRIKSFPQNRWSDTFVTEAMVPDLELQKVDVNMPLWDALLKMDKNGVNQLPVMENEKIIGVLSRESVITFFSNQQGSKKNGMF